MLLWNNRQAGHYFPNTNRRKKKRKEFDDVTLGFGRHTLQGLTNTSSAQVSVQVRYQSILEVGSGDGSGSNAGSKRPDMASMRSGEMAKLQVSHRLGCTSLQAHISRLTNKGRLAHDPPRSGLARC
ncbi:Uncharacterized protein Fot_17209 [Forsythia ovata]|uniref:Uncharacterized protein n=1 Tax=Forsythia ovata TaxID=205694 RepID=A0ABD1VGS2_9LAMI